MKVKEPKRHGKFNLTKEEYIEKITEIEMALTPVEKEDCRKNFWLFNKLVMEWPDLYEPLHKRVCDFVQDNIFKKNVLLLLPRGTFKSTVVTVSFPLWLLSRDPKMRIMIANATYPMATSFVGQMQRHLQGNDRLKRYYGDMATGSPLWREDKFLVATNKESFSQKEASVTAYGITSNFVGSHFDYAVLDDLVTRENIRSREGLEKPEQFFKDTLDLVDPDKRGHRPIIIIGTTWHYNDLYARIQDKNNPLHNEFATLRLPAHEGEWDTGKLLFPERLSWEALSKQKNKQGTAHFSAQYMLQPVSEEDAVFKSDFKYYDETDIRGLRMNKFIVVDPAISQRKSADYSALVCVGVDHRNTWYILDIWRDRVEPKRLLDQIFIWDTKWKPSKVGIETVAFQKALQYYAYEEMRSRNHYFPIAELKHATATKHERILSLQPRYETGTIIHNATLGLMGELEAELRTVTKEGIKGAHDDMIDALAGINELAHPPKNEGRRRRRNSSSRHYPA